MSQTDKSLNVTFDAFAKVYCERQNETPTGLREILTAQKARFAPTGWILLECHMLDSSRMGSLTILPYGPNNTFKTIPDRPISPRGLASDMSVVIAILPASEIP